MMQGALDTLRRHWGYDSFRPMQEEIIADILAGRDTLGLLPTGGGKSVTFQVPALMLPGVTLVVTPLISLMKDQVDNLREAGIRAAAIHSGNTRAENSYAFDSCVAGRVKLLYLSPERLTSPRFIASLKLLDVSLIVVDEAHCISQWGYDFRPPYLRIAEVRRLHPAAPILALTASATPTVCEDIMQRLDFRAPNLRARSFHRPNLSYIVRRVSDKKGVMIQALRATAPGTAIVYVRSRRRTREIADLLRGEGFSADHYHAGLSPSEKTERQNAWRAGRTRIIVATTAFGMGIDKPDVRLVVHIDLPSSLEEYYQEAGRAGRDGKEAFALLIVTDRDKATLTRRLHEAFPEKEFVYEVYHRLGTFLDVPVGEGYDRTFPFDFNRFIFVTGFPPVPARSALLLLTRQGYIEYGEDGGGSARVMMLASKHDLYNIHFTPSQEAVLNVILRRCPGVFADFVPLAEDDVAVHSGLSQQEVYEALLALSRMKVLHFIPRRTLPYIYWPTSRELPRYLALSPDIYERRREAMSTRLEAMRAFAFNDDGCRSQTLLRYFGESDPAPCGRCDLCRSQLHVPTPDPHTLASDIQALQARGITSTADLMLHLCPPYSRHDVIETLRSLVDEES